MPKITPRIFRSRIGKTSFHPMRYSDIEVCFAEISREDIFLRVSFRKEDRARVDAEGRYELVHMYFHPDPFWPSEHSNGWAWWDVENPVIVRVDVYPLPRSVTALVKLDRAILRGIVTRQVKKLVPRGWTERRWRLDMDLVVSEKRIECTSQFWTGLREESPVEEPVSLESPDSLAEDDRVSDR